MKGSRTESREQGSGSESHVGGTGKVITMKLPRFSKEALRRIRRVREWERRSTQGVLGIVVGRQPESDPDS